MRGTVLRHCDESGPHERFRPTIKTLALAPYPNRPKVPADMPNHRLVAKASGPLLLSFPVSYSPPTSTLVSAAPVFPSPTNNMPPLMPAVPRRSHLHLRLHLAIFPPGPPPSLSTHPSTHHRLSVCVLSLYHCPLCYIPVFSSTTHPPQAHTCISYLFFLFYSILSSSLFPSYSNLKPPLRPQDLSVILSRQRYYSNH